MNTFLYTTCIAFNYSWIWTHVLSTFSFRCNTNHVEFPIRVRCVIVWHLLSIEIQWPRRSLLVKLTPKLHGIHKTIIFCCYSPRSNAIKLSTGPILHRPLYDLYADALSFCHSLMLFAQFTLYPIASIMENVERCAAIFYCSNIFWCADFHLAVTSSFKSKLYVAFTFRSRLRIIFNDYNGNKGIHGRFEGDGKMARAEERRWYLYIIRWKCDEYANINVLKTHTWLWIYIARWCHGWTLYSS